MTNNDQITNTLQSREEDLMERWSQQLFAAGQLRIESHLAEAADERLARRARAAGRAGGIAAVKRRIGRRLIVVGSAIAREPGQEPGRRSARGARIEGRV
jgi:hypothetical protein